jgi:predicted NAD-dependent protein-ADP-ribosyltransferase YbiA (DUF1768 family)
MLKSKFEPELVEYKTHYGIDNDDIDYDTSVYNYDMNGTILEIALGKIKYTFSGKGILFCSIYLVINDTPNSRIGIFEIRESEILNSMVDDELELEKGNIILFASSRYINRMLEKQIPEEKIIQDAKVEKAMDDIQPEVEKTDVMKLVIEDKQLSTVASKIKDEGMENPFTDVDKYDVPDMLPDENDLDMDEIIADYKESSKNSWIETFTRNNNYTVHANEGSGDCLFAVIRDAYRQIGKQTTVKKLRGLIAKELTQEMYIEYKELYTGFFTEYQSINAEMIALRKMNNELKRRIKNITDKGERDTILKEATELTTRYNKLKVDRLNTKELLDEFLYMQDINSVEDLGEFIMTSKFWADNWAISKLERILNMKLIILDESAYNNGDVDAIMNCGPIHNNIDEKVFSPDYYIMTSYNGNHYELISYKDKNILKFREIPFNIKTMVINKCLECNSGLYYLIDEFRNYKTKLGLSPEQGVKKIDDNDIVDKDIYDSNIVFMFHSKSSSAPKAGFGTGEVIPTDNVIEYSSLNEKTKTSVIYDWRKKLDDSWGSPFTIDGLRWNTVTHYVLASQYKKGFPDFYKEFALDSESELSTSLELAKAATSKSGKLENKQVRPENVTVDADYYTIGVESRKDQERYTALEAKFTQNLDLQRVLMETKRAKLVKFIRRNDPEPDTQLMQLRKKISL